MDRIMICLIINKLKRINQFFTRDVGKLKKQESRKAKCFSNVLVRNRKSAKTH